MRRAFIFAIAGASAAAALTVPLAAQGGRIGTLPHGVYVCALPGDASTAPWVEQPGKGFTITGTSSYRAGAAGGTYLLEGKTVTFTRGPMRGKKLMQLGSGLLQAIEKDGKMGRMRCHRTGPVAN